MAERSNTIDYAQAVLSKYPRATAEEWPDGLWTIQILSKQISMPTRDRDAAWRDAYERIYKTAT